MPALELPTPATGTLTFAAANLIWLPISSRRVVSLPVLNSSIMSR